MLEKIQKLEKETEKLKNELNDLINEQQQQPSSELINHKINALKNQLYYISKQLETLQTPVAQIQQANPQQQVVKQTPKQVQQVPKQTPKQAQSKKEKNLEAALGKNVMAIAASVLIFISLIFFGTLLVPYLTDTIKMVFMFFISFAFTILGLTFLQKDKENKWFLSISGCGMGAIYISLIISFVYFGAFNDIVLYIFIALWAIFAAVLSRTRSQLFEIIGQLGIFISVFWGVINKNIDSPKFTFLVIYFITTSLIFMLSNLQKEYNKNIISNIFTTLSLFILMFGSLNFSENKLAAVILPIYLLALIIFKFIYNNFKNSTGFILTTTFDFFVTFILIMNFFDSILSIEQIDIAIGIIASIYSVLVFTAYELKIKEENAVKIIPHIGCIILTLIALIGFNCAKLKILNIFLPIIAILLLYYAFKKCNNLYKSYTIIFAIFMFFAFDEIIQLLFIVLFIGAFIYLTIKNEDYNEVFKNILYFILLISVNILFDSIAHNDWYSSYNGYNVDNLFVITLLSIIYCKVFNKNPFTKDEEKLSIAIGYIVNAILMIYATSKIDTPGMCGILTTSIAVALYSINITNLFKNFNENLAGTYICLKYTILISTILNASDTANFIVDIIFFVIAITCIIIGFEQNYKSFRYYGLVLSLISVAKLTLIDITYSNSVGRAFSFFICGILCFAISLIYNKIDKNFKNK